MSAAVRLLAIGRIQHGIHPYWDSRIHPDTNVLNWSQGCDAVIWFEHNMTLRSLSHSVSDEALQVLVLASHTAASTNLREYVVYDNVVCPSPRVAEHLGAKAHKSVARLVSYCPWDCGIDTVKVNESRENKDIRLYVPLDGSTMDETGLFTIQVLEEVMKNLPKLQVTVNYAKSWPRKTRHDLKQRSQGWGKRWICTSYPFHRSLGPMQDFDWTYVPSIRSDFGIVVSHSLACNNPVLAYDVAPFNQFFPLHGARGVIIPCGFGTNWLGGMIARPEFVTTVGILSQVLQDDSALRRCRSMNWGLDKSRKAFRQHWGDLLGLEC